MSWKTGHIKPAGVSLALAIALMTPAGAHARPGAEAPRERVARAAVLGGIEVPAVQPVGSAPVGRPAAAPGEAPRQAEGVARRAGIDRQDAAVATAILVGVLLMGLWGYLAVGAVIAGAAALLEAGVRLVTGNPTRGRGWSDWPGQPTPSDSPTRSGVSRPAAAGARSRLRSRRTWPSALRRAR